MYNDDGVFQPKPVENIQSVFQQFLSYTLLSLLPALPWNIFFQTITAFFADLTYPVKDETDWWEVWYRGLTMDNNNRDLFFPVQFTELFVDITDSARVMNLMKTYFSRNKGWAKTGNFIWEFRAGSESKFWLAPTVNGPCVRVDPFYLFREVEEGEGANNLFVPLWDYLDLNEVEYRVHWGKYVPPNFAQKAATLYPRYNLFLDLRKKMDPNDVF
eukprot:TRINITY_DN114_c0_g1_i4.p1 TRINITY_DN114_c0_g1~~TRINITY_DN114_c0_g1_i4.p1  ORF type:complete len:250 (+),score=50.06 TRINITY_DN114_c0_g1_i4:108-752(+)